MMRRRLPWFDSNWPLRIGKKKHFMRDPEGGTGPGPPLDFRNCGF